MQNTANDELLSEVTLYDNTYRRNKVTQTLKPKTISSSVTQKMVDEYKLDLLQDRKKGFSTGEFKALIGAKPKTLDISADEKKQSVAAKEYSAAYEAYLKGISDYENINNKLKKNRDSMIVAQDKLSRVTEQKKTLVPGSKSSRMDKILASAKEKKVDDLKKEQTDLLDELGKLDPASDFKVMENKKQEYEESIKDLSKTQEANRQKMAEYKNILESKSLLQLPAQAPGENNDDYQKRLEEFLQPDINDAYIQSTIAYDQIKILKSNFSSLFNLNNSRRLAVVEGVIKELPDDARSELNAKWLGFHKKYREIYGFDNANIRTQELLNLINNFIEADIPGAKPKTIATKSTGLELKSTAPVVTGLESILSSTTPIVPTGVFPIPSSISTAIAPLISTGQHYKEELILDTSPDLYIILIEDAENNIFIGVSQSGVIGSYTVKPYFSVLAKTMTALSMKSIIDVKETHVTDAHRVWLDEEKSGLFKGDQFEEFYKKFFRVDGVRKNPSGITPIRLTSPDSQNFTVGSNLIAYEGKVRSQKKLVGDPGTIERKEWLEATQIKSIIGAGISIPKHDKIVNFGNVLLMYDRLLRHNMLSIKKKGGGNIENFKNVKVSDKFVDIITGALNKQNINNIYNELSDKEQELYNILVQVSNVHRYANIPKPNIKFLKDRLKIVEGEIEAGNDNLIEELTDILHTMILVKLITKKEATQHLQQYMDMNQ
jgi:hypothetical protein